MPYRSREAEAAALLVTDSGTRAAPGQPPIRDVRALHSADAALLEVGRRLAGFAKALRSRLGDA